MYDNTLKELNFMSSILKETTRSNRILDKAYIEKLKNDSKALDRFFVENSLKNIIYVLEKFGKLENGNARSCLLAVLKNDHANVRELAIKNLAKLKDPSLLNIFYDHAINDSATVVKRESVSAIGRLRDEDGIPYLSKLLGADDPKVVMQAIRGLLVFKNQKEITQRLKKLKDHPNEMIQDIIVKEFFSNGKISESKEKHDGVNSYLKNKVVHGDVLDVLKIVPQESIHLTFTSPPYYNARDYSIYQSYEEYLDFLEKVFEHVLRVTKEGRFFILNTSPIIVPRVSRAHSSKRYPIPYDIHSRLIKMGWEFIDDIVWLKPEASVKNRNAGFLQHRKPLAYKPNCVTEMLMVYRKKTHKLIDWNIKQYDLDKVKRSKVKDGYETTNLWRIDPCFDKVHSAVFPLELCNRVIKYYSFVEDLVFDPFAGSGTLGRAALALDRFFFLVEKEKKYVISMMEDFEKNRDFLKQDQRVILNMFKEFKEKIGK